MDENNGKGFGSEALWDCPLCGAEGISAREDKCPYCEEPQPADTVFYRAGEKRAAAPEEAPAEKPAETPAAEKPAGKKSRVLVGLWDCPYCGAKGLNGLKKHCPNCGHPQDEGTKFYLGKEKEYLDEKTAEQYGKGADWTCSFCGALNRYNATECVNCGASRADMSGDYFDNEKKQAEKEQRRQAQIDSVKPAAAPAPASKTKRIVLLAVLAALIGALLFLFIPRKGSATVSAKEWTRVIYTQNYEDVTREDWVLPADATEISHAEKIHHYDAVTVGYRDVEVERTREVFDHYDHETYTVNNGDGTFTERTRDVPVNRTERYTVTEQQPIIEQVPRYQTSYVYVHKEWVDGTPVTSTGSEDAPYWPEFTETPVLRESTRASSYKLTLSGEKDKVYAAYVPEDLFTALKTGDTVETRTSAGSLTAINGISVN